QYCEEIRCAHPSGSLYSMCLRSTLDGRSLTSPPRSFLYSYPLSRNQVTALFSASSTGTHFHPNCRSALADDTNIFLRPMRTASIVARGSRPRIRPVTISSTTPVASASAYGTRIFGEGKPV